jgi:hypothetical protein
VITLSGKVTLTLTLNQFRSKGIETGEREWSESSAVD